MHLYDSFNLRPERAVPPTPEPSTPVISPERYAELEAEERARAQIRRSMGAEPRRVWSPGLAAVLSFFIPGLGQLYKGHIANGVAYFFCTFAGLAFFVIPGVAVWIWGIHNAYTFDPNRPSLSADGMSKAVLLVLAALVAVYLLSLLPIP